MSREIEMREDIRIVVSSVARVALSPFGRLILRPWDILIVVKCVTSAFIDTS